MTVELVLQKLHLRLYELEDQLPFNEALRLALSELSSEEIDLYEEYLRLLSSKYQGPGGP